MYIDEKDFCSLEIQNQEVCLPIYSRKNMFDSLHLIPRWGFTLKWCRYAQRNWYSSTKIAYSFNKHKLSNEDLHMSCPWASQQARRVMRTDQKQCNMVIDTWFFYYWSSLGLFSRNTGYESVEN